jgi:nucleotide-binding universal stress UspA family protein
MVQRILCPTDLTANSEGGVAYALALARRNGAQLIVFHAASFPSLIQYPCELEPYSHWEQWLSKFKMDQLLTEAEAEVSHFMSARFGAEINDVAWKPRAALGRVAEEIVAAAVQEETDLIVMARRRRGILARVLSRSTSEAVSRKAPCPVLSIYPTQIVRSPRGWRLPAFGQIAQSS